MGNAEVCKTGTIAICEVPYAKSEKFVGVCPDNPVQASWRNTDLSLKERIRRKESPKGLPTKEWFYYLKKNYNGITAIVYSVIPHLRIILKK